MFVMVYYISTTQFLFAERKQKFAERFYKAGIHSE